MKLGQHIHRDGIDYVVIAASESLTHPGRINYRLARMTDGPATRAAAIANGTIVPLENRPTLRMDYWGLRHAAEDIFLEFGEGRGDLAPWVEAIRDDELVQPVIRARLGELLVGAEDWATARAKRAYEPMAMHEAFAATLPMEVA